MLVALLLSDPIHPSVYSSQPCADYYGALYVEVLELSENMSDVPYHQND